MEKMPILSTGCTVYLFLPSGNSKSPPALTNKEFKLLECVNCHQVLHKFACIAAHVFTHCLITAQ